jgi:exonuclease III
MLLMCAGIHPHLGPLDPVYKTFVQFNCNGVLSSKTELQTFLTNHRVKIAALQESKLTTKSKTPSFLGYNVVHKDRPVGRGGGLALLVHDSVCFTDLDVSAYIPPNDQTLELQGISAQINGSYIKVFNVYVPPASASTQYSLDLENLL